MKTQKELKVLLKECLSEVFNEKMVDYCMKETAYIVELSDGSIITIDKPSIKKHFCFGVGYCGGCSVEEWDNATEMAEHARTSFEYFKNANLRPIIERINDYTFPINNNTYKIIKKYNGESESNKLCCLTIERWGENWYPEGKVASKEDLKRIADGYLVVLKQFEKRLDTYLKRYGLSKVRTWTYISD